MGKDRGQSQAELAEGPATDTVAEKAAETAAPSVEVPIYESSHSAFQIVVQRPDPAKPGELKVFPPLVFEGVHRSYGVLVLSDDVLRHSGFVKARERDALGRGVPDLEAAVGLIESLKEFALGSRHPGIKSGGVWRRSARGRSIRDAANAQLAQGVRMYDLATVRGELERFKLAAPQSHGGESQEAYLARLQALLIEHLTGGGEAAAASGAAGGVTRGVGTRGGP